MPDGTKMKQWAQTVMVLATILLAATLTQMAPASLAFRSDKAGTSFEMKAAFVTIAFDIGQKCPKADSRGGLV